MIPGEIFPAAGDIELNAGRPTVTLDRRQHRRPADPGRLALPFLRDQRGAGLRPRPGRGMRLNIPAGTAVRFEPGQSREVDARGLRRQPQSIRLQPEDHGGALMAFRMSRARLRPHVRADRRRPGAPRRHRPHHRGRAATCTRLRRGGQVRRRQGDPRRHGPGAGARSAEGAVDTVITNALILDHWGIVKADIGLKDGRIVAIGKAGNPETQPGVDIVIGPGTEVIAGEGKIVTAGGIDTHIHFICPQQIDEALTSGVTTMFGGGTGPADRHHRHHLHARPLAHRRGCCRRPEACPINVGFARQGQRQPARGAARAGRGRRLRPQAARGLGHHPGRDRLLPARSPTRWTCRWRSTPTR